MLKRRLKMRKRTTNKKNNVEDKIHHRICNFIRAEYPHVLFLTDLSGLRVSERVAAKLKKLRSDNGIPDLLILEPRGPYKGLFIELKKDRDTIFTKKGTVHQKDHFIQQEYILKVLSHMGYKAVFGPGEEETKAIIHEYMFLECPYDMNTKIDIMDEHGQVMTQRWRNRQEAAIQRRMEDYDTTT
jgi:hypothetical protein